MGGLVEGGGGLVLGVAGAGDGGQGAEVEGAVDDVAARGQGVGQDAAGAGAVDVGAVGARDAARRAAALGDHAPEHRRHLRAHRARLEVLGHLGRVAQGRRRRRRREGAARADGVDRGGPLGPRAVGLDGLLRFYMSAGYMSLGGRGRGWVLLVMGNDGKLTVRLLTKAVRTKAASAPSTLAVRVLLE